MDENWLGKTKYNPGDIILSKYQTYLKSYNPQSGGSISLSLEDYLEGEEVTPVTLLIQDVLGPEVYLVLDVNSGRTSKVNLNWASAVVIG